MSSHALSSPWPSCDSQSASELHAGLYHFPDCHITDHTSHTLSSHLIFLRRYVRTKEHQDVSAALDRFFTHDLLGGAEEPRRAVFVDANDFRRGHCYTATCSEVVRLCLNQRFARLAGGLSGAKGCAAIEGLSPWRHIEDNPMLR